MCGEDTTNHNFFGSLMPLFSVDKTISRRESRGWKKPKLLKWWLQFQWAQLQKKKGGGGIRKVLSLSFGTCLHLQMNWNLHVEYNTIATLWFNTSNLSFSLAFCLHCDLADFFPLIFHVHYVKKESRCEAYPLSTKTHSRGSNTRFFLFTGEWECASCWLWRWEV